MKTTSILRRQELRARLTCPCGPAHSSRRTTSIVARPSPSARVAPRSRRRPAGLSAPRAELRSACCPRRQLCRFSGDPVMASMLAYHTTRHQTLGGVGLESSCRRELQPNASSVIHQAPQGRLCHVCSGTHQKPWRYQLVSAAPSRSGLAAAAVLRQGQDERPLRRPALTQALGTA